MRTTHQFSTVSMDTWVHIEVVSPRPRQEVEPAVQQALAWFDTVERICTRFDPSSEVMQLVHQAGRPIKVSRLLLEAAGFALELAQLTDGAFDPCVGATLEQ